MRLGKSPFNGQGPSTATVTVPSTLAGHLLCAVAVQNACRDEVISATTPLVEVARQHKDDGYMPKAQDTDRKTLPLARKQQLY